MIRDGEAYIPVDCSQLVGETGLYVGETVLDVATESTRYALIVNAALVKDPKYTAQKSVTAECGDAHLEPTVPNMHAADVLQYPSQQAALLQRLAERIKACKTCLNGKGMCEALGGNAVKDTLSKPLGIPGPKPDSQT
jgi:hypothetical protein